MSRYIRINPNDNVVVALSDILRGEIIEGIEALEPIARGHKMAITEIATNERVIKYGFPIGHATCNIKAGQWVHSHNLVTSLSDNLTYDYNPAESNCFIPQCKQNEEIKGFERSNGAWGIRNDLWIIPTVGCINGQAQEIARIIREECDLTGIDDVRAYTHNYGCSQLGDDHVNTRNALAAMIKHPNAGGILVIGLGCENNQLSALRHCLGQYDTERIKFLVAQDVDDEISEGVNLCKSLISKMRNDKRCPMPWSALKIGVKCGGSDGLSGITANPLVGMLTDWATSRGASVVLTEVPEMFGAETLLMNRAKDRETFSKVVSLINNFKDYFRAYGQPIYENPSPGNKQGGITTLEEKSLGCVQKGGHAVVTDVLRYAEPAMLPGLNLLNAPGNDLVASSALAFSGCQLVLFTTGRGTPFGTFVPTMKIATNSVLSQKKGHWIDFNAGSIAEGESMTNALQRLCDKITDTINGERLNHELTNTREIAIFKSGVTL